MSLPREGLVASVVVVVTRSELEVHDHGENVSYTESNSITVLASSAFANALQLMWHGRDEAAACSCYQLDVFCVVFVLSQRCELVKHECEVAVGSDTVK